VGYIEKIAIVVVVALIPITLRLLIRVAPQPKATVKQIPELLAAMSSPSSFPTFVVFLFTTPDQPGDDNAINLQFSLEDHKAGLDWVLIAPRNLRDEDRFVAFARSAGFEPERHEMNNVSYWRIETGDIASLCRRVITDLYRIPATQPLDLIVEGFKWAPSSRNVSTHKTSKTL
jgi:hypothetical protein